MGKLLKIPFLQKKYYVCDKHNIVTKLSEINVVTTICLQKTVLILS